MQYVHQHHDRAGAAQLPQQKEEAKRDDGSIASYAPQ